MDPRTRVLLEAPIGSTLLRLAMPNMLVMVAQAGAGLVETYFIGKLGTDALAGVALVFPVVMLMQMMSAGAIGGGIASSIARALGGGRRADANALALHALVISLTLGAVFTVALVGGGGGLSPARCWYGSSTRLAPSFAVLATWPSPRRSAASASCSSCRCRQRSSSAGGRFRRSELRGARWRSFRTMSSAVSPFSPTSGADEACCILRCAQYGSAGCTSATSCA